MSRCLPGLVLVGLVACGAPESPTPTAATLTVAVSSTQPRVGERFQRSAEWTGGDGAKTDVTDRVAWTVDTRRLREVGPSELEALAPGATTLTATYEGIEATQALEILAAPIVALAVTPDRLELRAGADATLTARATYADGTSEDVGARVAWSVDDPSVASVAAGAVRALSEGRATVEATLEGEVARATVVVLPASLTTFALTSTQATVELGQRLELSAIATYSDGTTTNVADRAGWAVRPASAGRIEAGRLVALEVGPVEVEARFAGQTATLELTVVPPGLVAIEIIGNTASGAVGELRALRARGSFRDGTLADVTDAVTWTSDRASVATVSGGIVRFVAEGEAAIHASHEGVVSPPVDFEVGPARLLFLRLAPLSLALGAQGSLTATGVYTDESVRDLSAEVAWSSSQPSVATVDAQGDVFTVGEGSTVVTATEPATGLEASVDVQVTPPELLAMSIVASATTAFVGGSIQLAVTGHFTDGDRDVTSAVTLTCAPQRFAFAADGLATAMSAGACVAHAQHPIHGVQTTPGNGSLSLLAVAVIPTALEIAPVPALPPGAAAPLRVVAHFNDGHVEDATALAAWSSQDPLVARVGQTGNAAGRLIAEDLGATMVVASAHGLTTSAPVSVYDAAVASLAFVDTSLWLRFGQERQVEVVGTFTDGSTHAVTLTTMFASDTPGVASVDSATGRNGIVQGVSQGQANVTATAPNGVSAPPLAVISDPGRVVVESAGTTPSFSFMTGPATALTIDVPSVGGGVPIVITDVDVEIDFSFNMSTGTCHPPYALGVLTPYLELRLTKATTRVDLIEIADWNNTNFTGAFTVLFDQSAPEPVEFWVPFISPLHPTRDSLDDFNLMDPTGTWTFTIYNGTPVDTCLTSARLIIEYVAL